MTAIFQFPVCLTYWPRKNTTHVDLHMDNSHKVWSWYDHTLPSYSVFVCWYVTWLCYLDLWPFDLEQLSYMAGQWSTLPPSLKTLSLSVLELESVAAILEGPGGQRTPTFLSRGVTYKAVPPSFDAMLMSLFCFIYWLWTETVVVDQVLLWFRPTLILSRIPDYNVCVNVNRQNWCDHCKKTMTVRYDLIQSRALSRGVAREVRGVRAAPAGTC